MTLDWNAGALAEGLACYERGEFFLAHEHWECVWLTLEEPQKSFLQALIQLTAAFHHLQRGNPTGAASLLHRASHRLNLCPPHFAGLQVSPLLAEIAAWLPFIENGAQPSPASRPGLRPIYPPNQPATTDSREA